MPQKTQPYSTYLSQFCSLVGVPVSRLSTEIAEGARLFWNNGLKRVWQYYDWEEIAPYGEARFVGNKLTYPNDLSKTAYWTATAMTITGDQLANPLDGRVTASKLLETTANSAHSAAHAAIAIIPNTTYIYSAYVRPNGRSWVYLNLNDGDLSHNCFFNVTTGALGTATNCTGQIQQVGAGYYLCSIQFTTSTSITATTSAITIQTSTDGSTLSYAGSATLGLYVWGALVQQTTNTGTADSLIAYDQTGEDAIETVFMVWKDSPFAQILPREQGYTLTSSGIQIIDGVILSYPVVNSAGITSITLQSNPVFLYYRKSMPDFFGDTYDSTDSYAVDEQVYFTASDGTADFYKCVAAASAGDTPATDPDKWTKLQIPDALFWPAMMHAFGDWLISDGQFEKAALNLQVAQSRMEDGIARQSRQQGRDFPLRVNTHVTSQARY
jgi:hypothetical protein